MNRKKNKFKLIKFLFYCLGFPSMCLTVLWLLSPMLKEGAMGDYPTICVIVPFVLWALVELIRIALKKFAKKGAIKQDVATLILVVCSTVLIIVPTFISDKALESKYNAIRKEAATPDAPIEITYKNPITGEDVVEERVLYNGVSLPVYGKIMGWATDSTNKGSSWFNSYIGATKSYISKWGLAGYGGSQKGFSESKEVNYDANLDGIVDPDNPDQIIIGKVMGYYEHLDFMEKGKLTYTKISAELNGQYKILTDQQAVYKNQIADITAKILDENTTAEDKVQLEKDLKKAQNDLNSFNQTYSAKIQTLGGQRARIYDKHVKALLGIIMDVGIILPDGLDINALGMTLPVGELLAFIGDILDAVGGINLGDAAVVDTIVNAICTTEDPINGGKYLEIATGLAKDNQYQTCAPAAEKIATDKSSYAEIKELKYKNSIYPQLLSFARLRRVLYIFAGLVVISLLVSDHYDRKIKQIEKIQFNDRVDNIIKEKGLVPAVVDVPTDEVVAETPVVDSTEDTVINDTEPTANEDIAYPQGIDLTQGGNENENK